MLPETSPLKLPRAPSCCWNKRFANCHGISLHVSLASKLNAHKSSEASGRPQSAGTTSWKGWEDFSPGLPWSGLWFCCYMSSSSKDSAREWVCEPEVSSSSAPKDLRLMALEHDGEDRRLIQTSAKERGSIWTETRWRTQEARVSH